MKHKNNYILTFCVLVLCVICFLSIDGPIRFQHEQEKREQVVKTRLIKIRTAEEKYRKGTGGYSGSFSVLIKSGYMADSLQYIPYADGEKFDLSASAEISKSGRQVPLMECGAQYQQYLKGLDKNSIANEIETANKSGRYPGLKIGDISTPNDNAGNWE